MFKISNKTSSKIEKASFPLVNWRVKKLESKWNDYTFFNLVEY